MAKQIGLIDMDILASRHHPLTVFAITVIIVVSVNIHAHGLVDDINLSQSAEIDAVPDLGHDGNAYPHYIETENGAQLFVPNDGFVDGANMVKIFGENKSTTLWSDDRRAECYEISIRIIAQMPVAKSIEKGEDIQKILQYVGLGTGWASKAASAVNSLNTNYIEGDTIASQLQNNLSKFLRKINPKSIRGVKFPYTNLRHFANGLDTIAKAYTIADFAVGAAIQEALAGDLALWRLALLETILKEGYSSSDIISNTTLEDGINEPVIVKQIKPEDETIDPVIFRAIKNAKKNLERSEDYWGALMVELTDRKSELIKHGLVIGVRSVQKAPVKLMTKYYYRHMAVKSTKAAATKASTVAGLWAFSLIATYATIDSILAQHKKAQVSVTSSTLAYLLDKKLGARVKSKEKNVYDFAFKCLKLQSEFTYYDQMVQISSGFLPAYKDIVTKVIYNEQPYKDAKTYFVDLRNKTKKILINLAEKIFDLPETLNQRLETILVIDCSGSMNRNDPKDFRLHASRLFIDKAPSSAKVALVKFTDRAQGVVPLTSLNNSSSRNMLKHKLSGFSAGGGTSLSAGLNKAFDILNNQCENESKKAIVLLTDGKGDYKNEARSFKKKEYVIYTVGLGSDVDTALLHKISYETGGEYYTADNFNKLLQLFDIINSEIYHENVLISYTEKILPLEEKTCEFSIDDSMATYTATLMWSGSNLDILFLKDPNGRQYSRYDLINSRDFDLLTSDVYEILKVFKSIPGTWAITCKAIQVPPKGENFTLQVTGKAELGIIIKGLKEKYNTGENLLLDVFVKETGKKVMINKYKITLTYPNGKQATIIKDVPTDITVFTIYPLTENVFRIIVPILMQAGEYTIKINVWGSTENRIPYVREIQKSLMFTGS